MKFLFSLFFIIPFFAFLFMYALRKFLKKSAWFFIGLSTVLLITSCASTTAFSPCPNYGQWCDKTAINTWNNSNQ